MRFSTGVAAADAAGEPGAGDAELEEVTAAAAAAAAGAGGGAVAAAAAGRAFVDPPLPVESGVVAGVADPDPEAGSVATGGGGGGASASTTTAAVAATL